MMKYILTIAAILASLMAGAQGIWSKNANNIKQNRLMGDSVIIVPRDTTPTNNATYLGQPVGDSGRIAYKNQKLYYHNGGSWQPVVSGSGSLTDFYTDSYIKKDSIVLRRTNVDTTLLDINIGYVNVEWYGAVGDSLTDNTNSINKAINSLPSRGGIIFFPPGRYLTSGNITIAKPITIRGAGAGIMINTSTLPSQWLNSTSAIICTDPGNNLFIVDTNAVSFANISLSCNQAAPTNTGILFNRANNMRLIDVGVKGFGVNVDIINGSQWIMESCEFYGPQTFNLKIRFQQLPDGGDQCIYNSFFYTGSSTGITHIKYISGGGLKITSTKFNQGGGSAAVAATCIDLTSEDGPTSDLLINNCSFENFNKTGIILRPQTTFQNVVITGNQFAPIVGADTMISCRSPLLDNVIISSNTFLGSNVGLSYTSGNNVIFGINEFSGVTKKHYNPVNNQNIELASSLGIGGDASRRLSVYSREPKTDATAETLAEFVTSESSGINLGLFVRLGTSSTPGNRWTGLSSYENGTGDRPLILQDLGGMVGINSPNNPTSTLHVAGSFANAITTTGSNISLTDAHGTLIATSALTVTLPTAASAPGRIYYIVNYNTGGNVTFSIGVLKGGATVTTMTNNAAWRLQSNGTSWYVTGE